MKRLRKLFFLSIISNNFLFVSVICNKIFLSCPVLFLYFSIACDKRKYANLVFGLGKDKYFSCGADIWQAEHKLCLAKGEHD